MPNSSSPKRGCGVCTPMMAQTPPYINAVELLDHDGRLVRNSHEDEKNLIDASLAEEVLIFYLLQLRQWLPIRIKWLSSWVLLYSTAVHGFSLATLYSKCKGQGALLIAIRDEMGQIFGAYCSESLFPQLNHYGTGEWYLCCLSHSFLWKQIGNIPQVYKATGKNPFYIIAEPEFIAIGCGEGKFGLLIESDMFTGQSNPVSTFDNETLSAHTNFEITVAEIWSFK